MLGVWCATGTKAELVAPNPFPPPFKPEELAAEFLAMRDVTPWPRPKTGAPVFCLRAGSTVCLLESGRGLVPGDADLDALRLAPDAAGAATPPSDEELVDGIGKFRPMNKFGSVISLTNGQTTLILVSFSFAFPLRQTLSVEALGIFFYRLFLRSTADNLCLGTG